LTPLPQGARRLCLCLCAAAAASLLAGCEKPVFESLDITGATYGQGFSLLDTEGGTRTLADYKGRVVLMFFGFTQCPDICPTALSRAAELMALLGRDAARVQVVFVTVDPERDLPVVLREYTRAFHPSFIGLHASLEVTAATAKDFKVFYKKVPTGGSYTMDHTAITYAFDPQGRLRLAIRHEQTAASVAADVRLLLGAA
jgi:protein SCO1/2